MHARQWWLVLELVVVKGEELVLSRARKKEFMEALTRYWGEVIK